MSDLDAVFRPSSVAVIGASRRPSSIGREILANLLAAEFTGTLYAVNPHVPSVLGVKSYSSVQDIPDPVDLAVVVVPRQGVAEVVDQCAAKGVRGLVVITAGFKEVGGEWAQAEAAWTARAKAAGMRVIGPNCMGVLNTAADVQLNATFARTAPSRGPLALISQSGALGEAILAAMAELSLGMSMFASIGNKADVSGNDLLEYLDADPATRVILMYLESFGKPTRFKTLARRITRNKPILAVKSGRSRAGARAASSHTGALAGLDVAVDSLFAQCGVVRCTSMEDLFVCSAAFASQPLPSPRGRTAILTNAGGPGIMAADACEAEGLPLADLSEATRRKLAGFLHPEASLANPVDMIASATPEHYRQALATLLSDGEVDGVLALFVSPITTAAGDVADKVLSGILDYAQTAGPESPRKPVMACFMGTREAEPAVRRLRDAGIPVYAFPESAARAMSALRRHARWLATELGSIPELNVDKDAASRILVGAKAAGRVWLTESEALDLTEAYGIRGVARRVVATPEEAIAFADEHGYPVVLKAHATGLLHKSDRGAVQVDLRTEREVKGAFYEIERKLRGESAPASYLVERMERGGRELIVGATTDPTFGHLVAFGLGGVFVEVMQDVAVRIHPVTDLEAAGMLESIRGRALLSDFRGEKGVDKPAVAEVILRLSRLLSDFPEIRELEINPLMGFADAPPVAVDVRARVGEGVG